MNPNITRTHSKKHSSYQFYSDDTSPNHNHTLGNLLQAECSSWGHDRFFINLWNGGALKPHAAYWIPICIAHFKESYEVKRNEVPMEGQCPGAVDMQSKVIQEKNDKSLHTGRPWFTECLFRICLPQILLNRFTINVVYLDTGEGGDFWAGGEEDVLGVDDLLRAVSKLGCDLVLTSDPPKPTHMCDLSNIEQWWVD